MPHLDHLRDGVRHVDEPGRRIAARRDDVHARRTFAYGLDDLADVDPSIVDRVRDLVEDDELVVAARSRGSPSTEREPRARR